MFSNNREQTAKFESKFCACGALQFAMPGSRSSNNESEHKSPRESGDDSEDESEILEESPCGRWLKRKEEVSSRSSYNVIATKNGRYHVAHV